MEERRAVHRGLVDGGIMFTLETIRDSGVAGGLYLTMFYGGLE